MDQSHLDSLSTDGVIFQISRMEQELNEINSWRELSQTKGGEFLFESLRNQLDSLRQLYSKIPAHHEHALTLLSGFQGEERALISLISKLENADNVKKSLDEEIQRAFNALKIKEKQASTVENSFIAEAALQQKEKEDART